MLICSNEDFDAALAFVAVHRECANTVLAAMPDPAGLAGASSVGPTKRPARMPKSRRIRIEHTASTDCPVNCGCIGAIQGQGPPADATDAREIARGAVLRRTVPRDATRPAPDYSTTGRRPASPSSRIKARYQRAYVKGCRASRIGPRPQHHPAAPVEHHQLDRPAPLRAPCSGRWPASGQAPEPPSLRQPPPAAGRQVPPDTR